MDDHSADKPAGTIPLAYATDRTRLRFRKWGFRASVAFVILAVGWFGYANRDEISLRIRRWYWARQCLAHITPPGTNLLVYDNPSALVKSNPDYMIDANPTLFYSGALSRAPSLRLPNPPAGYMPEVWKQYAALDVRTIGFTPPPLGFPSPMNFLGQRHTPSGKRRLVAISGALLNAYAIEEQISYLVLPLPGLLEDVKLPTKALTAYRWDGPYRAALLEPAIADPNDPTHLTIRFTIQRYSTEKGERTGILDVYVRDDDTMTFKVRDPATTQGL